MTPTGASTRAVAESDVEELALLHFAQLGYEVVHGPDIAPDEPASERATYSDVVLRGRLEEALNRLNPDVPPAAIQDALRRLVVPGRTRWQITRRCRDGDPPDRLQGHHRRWRDRRVRGCGPQEAGRRHPV